MSNLFKLKLISPEGEKYQTEASEVSLPTPGGQITVLPDHMPLISLLSPGEIILKINGEEHALVTEGGTVEIANNYVKILADTAEDVDSLDHLKIEEAKKHAEHLVANSKDDFEHAEATALLEKQIAKLNVLKRRKKYR